MKKRSIIITCLVFMMVMVSCGKNNKEAMKVGDRKISEAMLRYYAYNTQASYENYYYAVGSELDWSKKTEKSTLESDVKDSIVEDVKNTYILTNHASDFGYNTGSVTEDELKERLDEYKKNTDENLLKKMDISDDELESVFKTQILYEKICQKVKKDSGIKADPEDYRQVRIRFAQLPDLSVSKLAAANITEKIVAGKSFSGMALANGLEIVEGTMGKGDRNGDEFETKVMEMSDGEVDYVEVEEEYYIIECIEDYDEEATAIVSDDAEKKMIDAEVKNLVNGYKDEVKINNKVWDKINFNDRIWSEEELEKIAEEVSADSKDDAENNDDFSEEDYIANDSLDPVYTYLDKVRYENEDVIAEDYGDDLSLVANAAFLFDVDTMEVIYAKNAATEVAPASTTKMLTALTALEFLDENEEITVGSEIDLIAWDASTAYLNEGDKLTVKELMTGMLICSGNDAAYCLAYNAGKAALNRAEGQEIHTYNEGVTDIDYKDDDYEVNECIEEFLYYMNLNASLLGCKDVCFLSPDGYDTENQYVTASDLARIGLVASENDIIRDICALDSYYVASKDITWETTNQLFNEVGEYYYKYADGLKTGSTGDAGKCFVATAEDDDNRVISVVLGSDDSGRWEDTIKLLNYGLDQNE